MNVGVLVHLRDVESFEDKLKEVRALGLSYIQLCCWNKDLFTDAAAEHVVAMCKKYDITISTFWCGWHGPCKWNFEEGPLTLGLVPKQYRYMRLEELIAGSYFAKKLGVDKIATHVGFIPENPNDENYPGLISALKVLAGHCKANGQYFLFETGQETPPTLLRAIEDIGTGNLGINLDPANLILYGKANPVDALDVIGKYVMDVHAKDGLYPTNGRQLGNETPLGEGKVNFPALVARLKELGYDGTFTIEREISGEQQKKDIISAKAILESLI